MWVCLFTGRNICFFCWKNIFLPKKLNKFPSVTTEWSIVTSGICDKVTYGNLLSSLKIPKILLMIDIDAREISILTKTLNWTMDCHYGDRFTRPSSCINASSFLYNPPWKLMYIFFNWLEKYGGYSFADKTTKFYIFELIFIRHVERTESSTECIVWRPRRFYTGLKVKLLEPPWWLAQLPGSYHHWKRIIHHRIEHLSPRRAYSDSHRM